MKEYGIMNSGECLVKDCENKAFAKGVCNKHYQRKRNNGTYEKIPKRTCTKERCNEAYYAKDLCKKHYTYKRQMDKIWRS